MLAQLYRRAPATVGAVAWTAALLVSGVSLPASPAGAVPQVFFDDFSYGNVGELEAHGWTARTKTGWPGIENASWKKEGVSFPADSARPSNRILRMTSSTDGTPPH